MNFKDANAIGKVGEVLVIRWLENTGWLVTDCSDHKFFQDSGIDIVASKGGRVHTIDVKTDTYDTGNVFMETISNDVKGTEGCLYTSKADWWFYYLQASDRLLVFSPAEVGEYVRENENRYRVTSHGTRVGNREVYRSHGAIVPIGDLPGLRIVNGFSKRCK